LDRDNKVSVNESAMRKHHPMPMEDGFNPDHPLPLFLADRRARQAIGTARGRPVTSSRVFKAGILIAATTATAIAVLLLGDPTALFANVRTSLTDNLGLRPGTDQPAPAIPPVADGSTSVQSSADAQALPPSAKDAAPSGEIAASEPAARDQAEESEPTSAGPSSPSAEPSSAEARAPYPEALYRQFQAWSAAQDAQANANAKPAQPVQDAEAQASQEAPAQAAEDDPAPHRLTQKHRHALRVHHARAEARPQNLRKKIRRVQTARAERPPVQAAQAQSQPQSQPAQNAPGWSFLPKFGQPY